MSETAIDQRARDLAADARNRLIAHEEVCAERWRNVSAQIADLKQAVMFQRTQIWGAAGSVIFVLLTALAALLVHGVVR